jgi:hypothetical protein
MTPAPGEIHWKLMSPSDFNLVTKEVEGLGDPEFAVPIPRV